MHIFIRNFITAGVVSWAGLDSLAARAQTPPSFSIVGHIEKFTVDNPTDVFSQGLVTVNGVDVVLPKNTVVLMPAAYLTPQQIIACAPQGAGPAPDCPPAPGTSAAGKKSNISLADRVGLAGPPLPAYEIELTGNIVGGKYIAGLTHISQQPLNSTSGYIRHIDVANAELCVGTTATPVATCAAPDTRVRINDPMKRYGKNNTSPDQRFSVDPDNPTIHAQTGYPMCISTGAGDATCPLKNRPMENGKPAATFVMGDTDLTSINAALPPGHPTIKSCKTLGSNCDGEQQAPFMEGDHITFQGTLVNDGAGSHPYYVSAHTVEANVGIYTQPGKTAYIFQEKSLIGTQGPITGAPPTNCAGLIECTTKLRIVGFVTDPTRTIGAYAVDVLPNGTRVSRKLPSLQKTQAPFGRFRFEDKKDPTLTPNGFGVPREIVARIDDAPWADGTTIPDSTNSPGLLKANGLVAGQYVAPVGEYIFPEALQMGAQPPTANFQCLAFLTKGWATPGIPPIGQLSPWPDAVTPVANSTGVRCDN
jgi:hypothetical protein